MRFEDAVAGKNTAELLELAVRRTVELDVLVRQLVGVSQRSWDKSAMPPLYVVRNRKARWVPYPTLNKAPSVLQPQPHRPR